MTILSETTDQIAAFMRKEAKILSTEQFSLLDDAYKNMKMYLENGGFANEKRALSALISLITPIRSALWRNEKTKSQAQYFDNTIFQPADSQLMELLHAEREFQGAALAKR